MGGCSRFRCAVRYSGRVPRFPWLDLGRPSQRERVAKSYNRLARCRIFAVSLPCAILGSDASFATVTKKPIHAERVPKSCALEAGGAVLQQGDALADGTLT